MPTIGQMFIAFDLRDWRLAEWEYQLLEDSDVFRWLCYECARSDRDGDELVNVTAIWEKSGCAEAIRPTAAVLGIIEGGTVEDRGEAGVWADSETAAWWAHAADPNIEPWMVIERFM